MSRKILGIIGGLILGLAIAGGSFYGGIVFQRSRTNNIQAAFFANRGGGEGGGGGNFFGNGNGGAGAGGNVFGNGNGGGNGGAGAGRGAVGQIKSIDGDTITLSTPQSVITVTMTDATTVQKVVAGATTDLQVGTTVIVRGERDANGNVTATSIQITVPGPNPAP